MRTLQGNLEIWGLAGESEAERHRWPLVAAAVLVLFYQASLQSVQRWSGSAEQSEVMKERVTNRGFEVNVG